MIFKRPVVAIAVIYAVLIILLRPLIPVPEKVNSEPHPFIAGISSRFMSVIERTMPPPYDALLGSIMFGGAVSPLDPDTRENYRKAGLAHLLVASGTHLSILIGVCLSLMRGLKVPTVWAVVLTSFVNLTYAVMAGLGASIVRAAAMAQLVLLGKMADRETDIYTSLGLAALVLMILNPLVIFEAGFQLSFVATWGLVYLCPALEERGLPNILAVSLSPILVTLPITVYSFNQISLAALPVNVLVIPWVGLMMTIGFISTFFGSFFIFAAEVLTPFLLIILKLLDNIVMFFSSIPMSCIYIRQPAFVLVIAYYAALVYITECMKNKRPLRIDLRIAAALLLCLFVWNAALSQNNSISRNDLQVSFIDVKQGDSIFVKSPGGKTMLIDAGPGFRSGDAGRSFVMPFLKREGINKLDVVVVTHPHDDHVGGIASVLKAIPVGVVYDSGMPHTSRAYRETLRLIEKKGIKYRVARSGDIIDLGGGVLGEVLGPSEPLIGESALNNNSVVIRLTYGAFSALFTGDAEKEAEEEIMKRHDVSARLLKVGHHGSKTSSSADFLKAVKPRYAVISVGEKNKFRHPHPSAVKRLEETGAKIFRTDKDGTITFLTDGESVRVTSSGPAPSRFPRNRRPSP